VTRIDQIIDVSEGGELTLQLPPGVAPGRHRLVAWIDPADRNDSPETEVGELTGSEAQVVEQDGLLVITGTEPFDIVSAIDDLRREREAAILGCNW
jgi:hypothetical protein